MNDDIQNDFTLAVSVKQEDRFSDLHSEKWVFYINVLYSAEVFYTTKIFYISYERSQY